MSNYVEFFRFSDGYEDVFCEDNHYLYVCAEPFNWAYMLACNPYEKVTDRDEWLRHDTDGADTEYLQTLKPAPEEIAKEIIRLNDIFYRDYMAVDYLVNNANLAKQDARWLIEWVANDDKLQWAEYYAPYITEIEENEVEEWEQNNPYDTIFEDEGLTHPIVISEQIINYRF